MQRLCTFLVGGAGALGPDPLIASLRKCSAHNISQNWAGTQPESNCNSKEVVMGKGILLWMLGVPIPVIILLALIFHH